MLKRNNKLKGGRVSVPPAAPPPIRATPPLPPPASPVKDDQATPSSRVPLLICLTLVALVFVVYARTLNHEFVGYDDDEYAYENPHLMGGISADNVWWALTQSYSSNWHPLTWVSHMLDWDLYGEWAGGHHLTSVLIHAANAVLFFLALRAMTGRMAASAVAVALWALHPLRVESVAWVSERKDVLSGLFFALTLLAYIRYTRVPSLGRYALVALVYALGLMSKPMLVTVPCVLLLLDFWPLRRLTSRDNLRRAILEKLPLLLIAVASSLATVQAQGKAVRDLEQYPLMVRVGNATDAYLMYLVSVPVPACLAVYYPHPGENLPWLRIGIAAVVLVGVSLLAILARNRFPYLPVGWFWYVGMLVPVIGFVQVGTQSRADRYTYLPHLGLWIAIVWGMADLVRGRVTHQVAVGAAAVLATVFAVLSWQQTAHWRNTITLFSRALECTVNNDIAHRGLGISLMKLDRMDEAETHFRRAIEISNDVEAHVNMGFIYSQRGQLEDASEQFREAMERAPRFALPRQNLSRIYVLRGLLLIPDKPAEAAELFEEAIALYPDHPEAKIIRERLARLYLNMATGAEQAGQMDVALERYRQAAQAAPDLAEARKKLGLRLLQSGNRLAAIPHLVRASELDPEDAEVRNALTEVKKN